MENKDYIKIPAPFSLPTNTNLQKKLDDSAWKQNVFFHLLSFYKNCYCSELLKQIIEKAEQNPKLKVEDEIAKFIRKYLRKDDLFCQQGLSCDGGILNDEDVKGIYDISFSHSYWRKNNQKITFHFECKNLTNTQNLVNKYVYYNTGNQVFDGGVYRFFNGKYAQNEDFGGMIGFVLDEHLFVIKNKIFKKIQETTFDTTPEGDFIRINDNSIENNDFTFDSYHNRQNKEFVIHHLLFNMPVNNHINL